MSLFPIYFISDCNNFCPDLAPPEAPIIEGVLSGISVTKEALSKVNQLTENDTHNNLHIYHADVPHEVFHFNSQCDSPSRWHHVRLEMASLNPTSPGTGMTCHWQPHQDVSMGVCVCLWGFLDCFLCTPMQQWDRDILSVHWWLISVWSNSCRMLLMKNDGWWTVFDQCQSVGPSLL